MKKGIVFGLCFLVLGVFLLVGCGNETPTVNTSNPTPQNLSIRGTVYGTNIDGSLADPVAGAHVTLSGSSATCNTVTDAKGEYTIANIPDGGYTVVVTMEGYQRNSQTSVWIKPSSNIPADGTITVADIQLNPRPIVLSYSPVPASVVTPGQVFTVVFNKAIDRSSFQPMLSAAGIRTMVTDGSNMGITVASTDNKTFTITPTANLISNESYMLTVNNSVRDAVGNRIQDPLVNSAEQAMSLTETYRVGTVAGAPGDVTNLALVYNIGGGNATTEADYLLVHNAGPIISLSWTSPTTGGPITGYNVYVAYGPSGDFHLANPSPIIDNQAIFATLPTPPPTIDIVELLYGLNAFRDPVCTGGYPFINDVCRFKVVALNGDGESPGTGAGCVVSARDTLGPMLDKAGGFGNAWNEWDNNYLFNNNVMIPNGTSYDNKTVFVGINEPILPNVVASKFHGGTFEATSAELVTTSANLLSPFAFMTQTYSIVKVVFPYVTNGLSPGFPATDFLTVEAGAFTDLSGNPNLDDSVGEVIQ